jgi:hypothetical protein
MIAVASFFDIRFFESADTRKYLLGALGFDSLETSAIYADEP